MSKSFFNNILRDLDQFGVKPKLNLHTKDRFTTLSGGVISIFYFILIILGCVYFGQELVYKNQPYIVESSNFDQDPRRYNFTKNNFGVFFGIEDSSFRYYIDPTIYTLDVNLQIIYRKFNSLGKAEFNFTFIPLRVEQCNLQRHFPNFQELFKDQPVESLHCIHPDDLDNAYMLSAFGEIQYTYISAKYNVCKNNSGVVCQSQENIDKLLSGAYTAINFVDTIYDPSNYTTPYKFIRKDYFTTVSNKIYKEWVFYLRNIDYITDGGILFDSTDVQKYLSFEKTNEFFDLRIQDNFLQVALRLSNIRYIYSRKYMKFQDFLAQMGGLIGGLKLILNILLSHYFKNKFFISQINRLFILEEKLKSKGDDNKREIPIVTFTNENTFKTELKKTHIDQTEINEKNLHSIKSQRMKLKLSICEYIKMTIFSTKKTKNNKFMFLVKGKNRIEKNLDLVSINNVIEDFNLMKIVVFDKEANSLFSYLSHNKILSLKNNQFDSSNHLKIVKAYNTIKQNDINDTIKEKFEEYLNVLFKSNIMK